MYGSSRSPMKMKKPEKPQKPMDKKKPKKKSEISPAMMKRLKEHSKLHKGGMESPHMKSMIKNIASFVQSAGNDRIS